MGEHKGGLYKASHNVTSILLFNGLNLINCNVRKEVVVIY